MERVTCDPRYLSISFVDRREPPNGRLLFSWGLLPPFDDGFGSELSKSISLFSQTHRHAILYYCASLAIVSSIGTRYLAAMHEHNISSLPMFCDVRS